METNKNGTAGADCLHDIVRLTWRKRKRREGMMSLPEAYNLHRGDKILATCQRLKSGDWFWYSRGMNTADAPTDLETAKHNAKVYILANAEVCHGANNHKGNDDE